MADDNKLEFETIDKERYNTDNEKSWVFSTMKSDKFDFFFLNAEGESNRKGLTIRHAEDIPALIALLTRMASKYNK